MLGINILQNPAIQSINLNNPTWDMFILLLFVTIAFFYGIFISKPVEKPGRKARRS